jgi:hypothetical protein
MLRSKVARPAIAWTKRQIRRLTVTERSPYDNIYHCCIQKTASQWFRQVFSDPVIYNYTGLEPWVFSQTQPRIQDAQFAGPLPKRTVCIHLYIDYRTYQSIPKPTSFKTFYVVRDPRDIVVSEYFSLRYSHALIVEELVRIREELQRLDINAGLRRTIDYTHESGVFEAQRSWFMPNVVENADFKVFRYEDLARDGGGFLKQLLAYLDIHLPESELAGLTTRYAFKELSGGRPKGEEDVKHHYRKGIPGDWKNYLDDSLLRHLEDLCPNLVGMLGY